MKREADVIRSRITSFFYETKIENICEITLLRDIGNQLIQSDLSYSYFSCHGNSVYNV